MSNYLSNLPFQIDTEYKKNQLTNFFPQFSVKISKIVFDLINMAYFVKNLKSTETEFRRSKTFQILQMHKFFFLRLSAPLKFLAHFHNYAITCSFT